LVSHFQQGYIPFGIRWPTPFAREVGLVPDRIGTDTAFVTSSQSSEKVGEIPIVVGGATSRIVRPQPGRGFEDRSQYVQASAVCILHDAVGAAPIIGPFSSPLYIDPGEDLFHPRETSAFD